MEGRRETFFSFYLYESNMINFHNATILKINGRSVSTSPSQIGRSHKMQPLWTAMARKRKERRQMLFLFEFSQLNSKKLSNVTNYERKENN